MSSINKSDKSIKRNILLWNSYFQLFTTLHKHLSHDTNKFKLAWKKFILAGFFYSYTEYFEWNLRSDMGTY